MGDDNRLAVTPKVQAVAVRSGSAANTLFRTSKSAVANEESVALARYTDVGLPPVRSFFTTAVLW